MGTDESRSPHGRLKKPGSGVWRLGLAVALGVGLGWLCSQGCAPRPTLDYPLMAQAWDTIQDNYVDRSAVKSKPATYGAIGGMVDSLGDTGHSSFLSPEMVKEFGTTLHGGASDRGRAKLCH